MKKDNWRKWVAYKFDNFVTKGIRAQFILLLIVITIIIFVTGLITHLFTSIDTFGGALWQSLLHILGAATVGDDDTSDVLLIIVMLAVSLLGMAFLGTIIGIINNAIEEKLGELKTGHTRIVEKGHVVIIGFDNNIHTILSEIKEGNENYTGNRTIVVVDPMPAEEMEFAVKEHTNEVASNADKKLFSKSDKLKSKVLFRTGSLVSENTFEIASVEKARSIIINDDDDFEVIRIMLALTAYLKKCNKDAEASPNVNMPTIVSLMHKEENVVAAQIAAGNAYNVDEGKIDLVKSKVRVLFFEDILARIFAQVCRQPGLSWVVSEFFDYANTEIYIEDIPDEYKKNVFGKTFGELSRMLSSSIAIGIQRDGTPILNVDKDADEYRFRDGDKLIHIAEDDNMISFADDDVIESFGKEKDTIEDEHVKGIYHFVVFGWSIALPEIVQNIDSYCKVGSTLTIVTNQEFEFDGSDCLNLTIDNKRINLRDWPKVERYLSQRIAEPSTKPTNIVILCGDEIEKVEADKNNTVLLLNVRSFLTKNKVSDINITTEMNLPENQALLAQTSTNDFIVGSEMANRMMVQVSNNPHIHEVFTELLNDEGSEIYLRPISEYVDTTVDFNFNFLQKCAMGRGNSNYEKQEIALGWLHLGDAENHPELLLNPVGEMRTKPFSQIMKPSETIDEYRLVVLARE